MRPPVDCPLAVFSNSNDNNNSNNNNNNQFIVDFIEYINRISVLIQSLL